MDIFSARKSLLYYLVIEIVVLTGLYLLTTNWTGDGDFVVQLLFLTMLVAVIAGIFFAVAFTILWIRNSIAAGDYAKYFLLSLAGVVIPFVFLFLLLSQLH